MSDAVKQDWKLRVRGADALLFDFDGTLAPNLDLPDLRRRVIALTSSRGVPEHVFTGRYIVEILEAGTAWLAAREPAAARALDRDGHGLIRQFEVDAARRTEPFPQIRETLEALGRHGKRLAVITRNCRAAVLAAFPDLERYCDVVLARDDVAHLKPDVRHLQQALDALERRASRALAPNAIMVGDGQLDMHIGRAAGMYCLGVESGSSDRQRLLEAGADAVVEHVTELRLALAGS